MKILLAYDASFSSETAMNEVLHRPWPEGTTVRLVTVIDRPLSLAQPYGDEIYAPMLESYRARLREAAYERIQMALAKFKARPDLQVSYEIRDGGAKAGLLEAISAWGPDLVVAGSHDKDPISRFLLGSVGHALVTHAPCSVEIVKKPAMP